MISLLTQETKQIKETRYSITNKVALNSIKNIAQNIDLQMIKNDKVSIVKIYFIISTDIYLRYQTCS